MLLRCSLQATMFDLSCRVHIQTSSGKMLINHRVCIICMHVCETDSQTPCLMIRVACCYMLASMHSNSAIRADPFAAHLIVLRYSANTKCALWHLDLLHIGL